ncbi:MAG: aminotransferase class I/II-fold pyridoxal phosphate-dependent enzyme [Spirochaetales bacterium]|nr:aminotransferase class I/II-fold pyridoxal phosphate-dependent enzyme [Spirochaetales bacterium]
MKPMKVIDLRRDTITLPDQAMREAAFAAPLGDSVYGEDPKQEELEDYAARLLGKERALFLPSGTMGNLAALLAHTRRGDEIILEENAHIRTSESGGAAAVAGLMIRTVAGTGSAAGTGRAVGRDREEPDGAPDPEAVEAAIRPDDIHYPRTGLICLESTHYRYGGIVPPVEKFARIREIADRHGLPVHLDGARLFNAALYLGVEAREIAGYADSVMISLSKGLGAPVGSLLCGSAAFIARAARARKMLGGGMRQTGWLCTCGLVALSPENIARLAEDHGNARLLAEGLAGTVTASGGPAFAVDLDRTHTNYVLARLTTERFDAPTLAAALRNAGVLVTSSRRDLLRFVTSKQVDRAGIAEALSRISDTAGSL